MVSSMVGVEKGSIARARLYTSIWITLPVIGASAHAHAELCVLRIIIPFFGSVIKVAIYIRHEYTHRCVSEHHCMDNVCSFQDTLLMFSRVSFPLKKYAFDNERMPLDR